MPQKRSIFFFVLLFLGICYLWPWAIRRKSMRLEAEALQNGRSMTVGGTAEPKSMVDLKLDTPLHFPVEGKSPQDIISHFGDTRAGGSRSHEGIDIGAPRGTAVFAVADGIVEKIKNGGNGGKQIWISLENGWQVYYAHLHAQLVEEGRPVRSGQLIGTVGSTGNAKDAGPHLHFCLYPTRDEPVDPLLYFEP